jgi:hypothetical protein
MIRTQTWKMSGHREREEFIYTTHNFLKNNSISFPDVAVYGMYKRSVGFTFTE